MNIAIRKFCLCLTACSFAGLATPGRSDDPEPTDKTTVAVLVFDRMEVIDFAGPMEIFGWAGFEVFTVSKSGDAIQAWPPLKVQPEHSFESAPDADIILVPGGWVSKVEHDEETLAWLKRRHQHAEFTLSVCTGARILANAGLLDAKEATTFFGDLEGLAKAYPKVHVVTNRRFVHRDKIVTSAGLVSGIDSALYLVSELLGEKRARTIAAQVEYPWKTSGGYVRGLMADRHIPDLKEEFPQSWNLKPIYSYGDQMSWSHEFSVGADQIGNSIGWLTNRIGEIVSWDLQESNHEHMAMWTTKINGVLWRMTAKADVKKSVLSLKVVKE